MTSGALRLSTVWDDNAATVTVAGELDTVTSDQLSACAQAALGEGARLLTVQMTDVSFIATAGLHALLSVADRAEGQHTGFRLGEVSPTVARLMKITGLDRLFLARSRCPL